MSRRLSRILNHLHSSARAPNKRVVSEIVERYGRMSLTKIPFILLATWGIEMVHRPPNPKPPQHERFSSPTLTASLENFGFVQWSPFTVRVRKYSEDIWQTKLTKSNPPTDRPYNSFFALLRYQLSWHLRTLHRLYPNQYCPCSFGTVASQKTFTCQTPPQ